MSIRHVAIVTVPVSDPARAKAFYCDKLGFEVRRDSPMGSGRRWIEVVPPGSTTSLTLVTWFEKMRPGSVQGLVLDTADINQTTSTLRSKGVKVGEVESAPWGRYVNFTDPDGNRIVLQQSEID